MGAQIVGTKKHEVKYCYLYDIYLEATKRLMALSESWIAVP